ncbi:RidA family protein [Amycolatopsis sp. Poz14]|uniref:RidA family protein n=1 Tax=Amycolatopsis sp. Poz14 TaxID=1447705 RepID=UPI001EE80D98|nr:RidA family protein [Amycolatopsis sp. Poz14]MCG3752635.1 RidA family protein [Amycolatopsis sp. Poz14]
MPVTDYVKPEGLYRPRGFAHVAVATGAKVVEIGGQISVDVNDQLQHPGDYAGQTELALRNVVRAAEGAGARVSDIAKLRIYIVDYRPEINDEVFGGFGAAVAATGLRVPAMLVVGISALAFEGALVEIDATAYC